MRKICVAILSISMLLNFCILTYANENVSVNGEWTRGKIPGDWRMDKNLTTSDASFIGEELTVRQGWSISISGDINGDGFDDILVGAPMNDRMWRDAGRTSLFFGGPFGWAMDMNLTHADASFLGENQGDNSGISVSGAGDVNGDGYDDILIGANYNDEGGNNAGQTYLIFGKASGLIPDIYLSSADASFIGESAGDESGWRVSIVGDVNDDGFDDILIGAQYNDEGGNNAGQTYLILGKASGWEMDMSLSTADASFIGEGTWHISASSISGAGDVNRDGFDDILIGAGGNDEGGLGSGQTYLILGKASGWTKDMNLSLADASFLGENKLDSSARSITGTGDVNGDGFDDFMIGATSNSEGGEKAGQAYLILGMTSGWTMDVNLSMADASFIGELPVDYAGMSLAGAGDVNGDGFDDILIGAAYNDEPGVDAGQSYLILGKASGWAMDTNLSLSDASFHGDLKNVTAGYTLTGSGDVNGDGYDDIMIGSRGVDLWGEAYLLFGYLGYPPKVTVDDTFISDQVVDGVLEGEVEIRWSASDLDDGQDLTIDIFYQKEGSQMVSLLTDGANTGSFLWNTSSPRVPDGKGYWIWIAATDSDNNTKSNRSMTSYEINNNDPPTMELTYPPDGFTITDTGTIEWTAEDGEDDPSELSIGIRISYDGGAVYHPIIENTNNTGSYQFQSRDHPDSETCRIKVTATDTGGMISEDVSGNFTIHNYPVFEYLTPSAGDTISGDFALYWSAQDPYYNPNLLLIDIWIMEADGSDMTLLAEDVSNDGFFKFNSSELSDWTSYMFMVNVTNPYGLVTTVFSENFTVFNNDAPVVKFITPGEGDKLTDMVEISWDSMDDLDDPEDLVFALYYKFHGTDLWNEIALNQPNNGSYLWNTNEALNGDGDYKLRVILKDSLEAVSIPSTVNVSIYNPDAPEIKYPIGPREQVRDGSAEFEWTAEDPDPGETEDLKAWIYHSQDGATWTPVVEGIPNENGYSMDVSGLDDGTYSVRLVISDCQSGDSNRSTEHIFEDVVVNNIDDAPVIEFLSEGFGSEIFGYEVSMIWRGEDADGDGITYSLYYQMNGSQEWVPISGAQNIEETSFIWNISDVEDGYYRVKIVARENYTLGLEDEYITSEIRIIKGYTIGGDDDGDRAVTINYGLLVGIGAGFVVLALIVIYIMFLSARKKEEEEDETDMGSGTEEMYGAPEEEGISEEHEINAEDPNLAGAPPPPSLGDISQEEDQDQLREE